MKKAILMSLIVSLSLNALTLKESVKEVMETNPELKEKKQNYESTLKDVDIAKTEWLPKIDLISSYNLKSSGKINNSVQDNEYTTFQNSLRLTQNLFNGYSTVNKIDYQEKRALSSFAYYLEAVNDVSLRMTKAYLDVLRNSLLLKNAKENVESTEKIYQDVKSLYDAGLTTKSEMIKIQASLSLAKSNYVVQQNNFMDKEFSFEKLYGKKVSVNELNKPELAFIPTKEEIDKLIVNNPSIFISQYNIESERALIKEKESKFYPIVNLEVEQTYNEYSKQNGFDGEDDRQRVGVTLNWNFYNGGKDKLEIEKQKVNVLKTKSSKEEIERQVKEGMELSYSAYTMLEKQLENLKEYNNFSLETLDKYKSEYELGRRTLLDLLSAQNDVVNSKSQLINAEFDRLFASYRILDSIGNINSYILEQKAELAEDDYYARLLKETASR